MIDSLKKNYQCFFDFYMVDEQVTKLIFGIGGSFTRPLSVGDSPYGLYSYSSQIYVCRFKLF